MITTHVLDTAAGKPAVGLSVVLYVNKGSEWVRVAAGRTDQQGRLTELTDGVETLPGVYRLTFDTGTYHRETGTHQREVLPFFPEVQVTFKMREAGEHIHVPLLISPFGYTTYRGT
jgi:5-hydroxyisourate hydrolase